MILALMPLTQLELNSIIYYRRRVEPHEGEYWWTGWGVCGSRWWRWPRSAGTAARPRVPAVKDRDDEVRSGVQSVVRRAGCGKVCSVWQGVHQTRAHLVVSPHLPLSPGGVSAPTIMPWWFQYTHNYALMVSPHSPLYHDSVTTLNIMSW